MASCLIAQGTQIVRDYAGAFIGAQGTALRLSVENPVRARLFRLGCSWVSVGDDDCMAMAVQAGVGHIHAGL